MREGRPRAGRRETTLDEMYSQGKRAETQEPLTPPAGAAPRRGAVFVDEAEVWEEAWATPSAMTAAEAAAIIVGGTLHCEVPQAYAHAPRLRRGQAPRRALAVPKTASPA